MILNGQSYCSFASLLGPSRKGGLFSFAHVLHLYLQFDLHLYIKKHLDIAQHKKVNFCSTLAHLREENQHLA